LFEKKTILKPSEYNVLIDAAGRCLDWRQALRVMAYMPNTRAKPNIGTFNAAMGACERSGKWKKTLLIFDRISHHKKWIRADTQSHALAINACEKTGKWKEALKHLENIKVLSEEPEQSSFVSAIKACGTSGQWEHAIRIFNEIKEPDVNAFTAVASACALSGQAKQALSFLSKLDSKGFKRTSFAHCVHLEALECAGDVPAADALFSELVKSRALPFWAPDELLDAGKHAEQVSVGGVVVDLKGYTPLAAKIAIRHLLENVASQGTFGNHSFVLCSSIMISH
jgi:pentatricopeptide repeat protein